jgi:hypothetical protein
LAFPGPAPVLAGSAAPAPACLPAAPRMARKLVTQG